MKDKLHASINILGLSLGMTVAMLIGFWIYDEVSFNKNFRNYDRIARVAQNVTNNGEVQTWWSVPYPLADELRRNYGADFKHLAMGVDLGDHHTIKIGQSSGDSAPQKILKNNGGFFEKEMPEMLALQMIAGDRKALSEPSSALISESAAKAFFGDESAIGKFIHIDQYPPLKVAGVYEDFPDNSQFAKMGFMGSWEFWYHANNDLKGMEDPWRPNFVSLFVQINDQAHFKTVSARIRDAKLKKLNDQLKQKKPALFLVPMSQWHLYSEYNNGVNTGGTIRYVWMFGVIGIFVLLLACINFMNLSTARSEKRAREVGIRKSIGSLRKQLVIQFFTESLLTVFFSFIISIVLVLLLLPLFNTLADKRMYVPWGNVYFWTVSLFFILFTAIVAGSYPAFYLSSFQPVRVLKGTFRGGRLAAVPRKILVVAQFTFSVALIIGTIIVYQQIQFAKNRPVGYTRERLLSIVTPDSAFHSHFDVVRNKLIGEGVITAMAESQSPLTDTYGSTSGFSWPGKDPNLSIDFQFINASADYGRTIGWNIKAGRDFERDRLADSASVILNEAAVKYMGLKDPVGVPVTWWEQPLKVIGVVENMIMGSPYDEAKPVIYSLMGQPGNFALLRLNPSVSVKDALAKIEPVYKNTSPGQPFEYRFVDDEYGKKFNAEERIGTLSGIFTALAIIISCLGLFGLTSFVAEQRKKEIGVRKVLGASVTNVWNLLSKDFVILVLIAFVIAIPLAWYFMHGWLQNYSYRTEISWWVFAAAGTGAILLTIITVSFQAIKAAVANPVKSLRTE